MYLFLLVVISASSSYMGNSFTGFFDMLVILSAVLLPIKSPVASAVSGIALLEAAFITSVVDF